MNSALKRFTLIVLLSTSVFAQDWQRTKVGGFDLPAYARAKYGSGAQVVNVGEDAFSWKIALGGNLLGLDMEDVARSQYGSGAHAAYSNKDDRNSWYAYRETRTFQRRTELGGFDLPAYAQQKYGSGAQVIKVGNGALDWKIVVNNQAIGLDMDDVARSRYGSEAHASYRDINNANSWYGWKNETITESR